MKKIFNTLVVLCAVIYSCQIAFANESVCACSGNQQKSVTGAACSISELKNLEKMKNEKSDAQYIVRPERDLRPVKNTPEITNFENCFLGKCLYKQMLDVR